MTLDAPLAVACDLSHPMLRLAASPLRVVADGAHPPFRARTFDAAFAINVIEHVPDPVGFVAACAEVIAPGGRLLLLTPNGDLAWLLEALERLRLKLPEGPHRFLGMDELIGLAGAAFEVAEYRRLLAFPTGPAWLVRALDRVCGLGAPAGRGLFHYVLLVRN